MAEKRQIQFECYTDLPLGGNWAGEWPAYVLVHHESAVDDVRYVPERTCRNLNPPSCRDFECSECGESSEFTPGFMPNYCPHCGARVEEASDDDRR